MIIIIGAVDNNNNNNSDDGGNRKHQLSYVNLWTTAYANLPAVKENTLFVVGRLGLTYCLID